MKFAIFFLLGLCAIVAHAEAEVPEYQIGDISIEGIRKKIEELITSATDKFSSVSSKVKEIILDINNQGAALVTKAKNKADGVRADIEGRLSSMKQKGGQVAECAKKYEPDYRQVEKDAMEEVKKCAGEVYVSSEEMREDVNRGMAALGTNIRNFRDLVTDCIGWNPINSVKCVKEKMDIYKKALGDILAACSASLRAAQQKSIEIMNQAHECNARALSKAKNRVGELNEKLIQCTKF